MMSRLLAFLAVLMLDGGAAFAFGTVNGVLGQAAEHEKITRLGLKDLGFGPDTLDALAGKVLTFGAVGAPDRPDRGLMGDPAAHCDGADHLQLTAYPQSAAEAEARLSACRAGIAGTLKRAVTRAGDIVPPGADDIATREIPEYVDCVFNGKSGRAKCDVLEAVGLAMHAAQDFYAHTNWVDRAAPGEPNALNPPGLGYDGPAPWLDPRGAAAFPAGLISGCYEGFEEEKHCVYGANRARVRHLVLNKDTGPIDAARGATGPGTTPRGAIGGNFERAVAAAAADTRDKWLYVESEVLRLYGPERGGLIVCALKSDDPDDCD